MAHDFNNLLTVILGNAEILTEELAGSDRLEPMAAMIVSAAERGADLTQRLLAFSRKQVLQPVAVPVNQQLANLKPLLQRTLGEHISIQLPAGSQGWKALVDPAQLDSSLLNLCLNARDAMPHGGCITIETGVVVLDAEYANQHADVRAGEYVLVSVSDTGTGISPEHMSRLFEPFFTTKEVGKGTGLGLPMVYGFVKQSGGHVSIYSEPGLGTTVKLYLPRADGDASESPRVPQLAANAGGCESVLLVEDDEFVRRYAGDQLRGLGYCVTEACNGAEALELLRQGPTIDLLFTDVVMPEMSGPDLVAQARQLRPQLKVLYTSGYTENALMHRGRLDPGIHLLTKPYMRGDLARQIRLALAGDALPACAAHE